MTNAIQWAWASAQAGVAWAGASPFPIRSLHAGHRDAVLTHLLTLSTSDRYLRFGHAASDAQIARYAHSLDFYRDRFFGVFTHDLHLVAMSHLATLRGAGDVLGRQAEFGVSVEAQARAQGLGRALFNRTALHARNAGVDDLYIYLLRENTAMLRIAQSAGAEISGDHGELDCWVHLTPATVETRLTEFWEEQRAQVDYHIKMNADNGAKPH